MPNALPRPCRYHGCGELTTDSHGLCKTHIKIQRDDYAKNDPSLKLASKFYDSSAWKNLRKMHLNNNPLCVICSNDGQVVDHIKPIRQGGGRTDLANLQTLCHVCHNKKRRTERGQI